MIQLFLRITSFLLMTSGSILEIKAFSILPPNNKNVAHHFSPLALHVHAKDEGPSYSDDFLLNFHNQDQANKQLVTNSLAVWNEDLQQEQARIIEWQDSFQRNNLADFTPPMSSGLNCLMVGGEEMGGKNIKLPWEDEAEADVTPLRVLEPQMGNDHSSSNRVTADTVPIVQTERVSSPSSSASGSSSSSIRVVDPTKTAGQYDCIVDQGLMDAVIQLNSPDAVQELLFEAAFAIREHGIYVLVTSELSDESRQLLEKCTDGFEWEFELDGISNDEQVVSVARRYCTGEMPKVGKLSRYQP